MTRLRVLLTGAGIGGSAAAFWLAKLNHDVTVLERHPSLRINGLQLDLRGYGIEVMKRMGLEKQVRAKLAPEEGVELVDSTGRRQAYFAANKSGKGAQTMTSEYEIMRCELCKILYDAAIEHGAQYLFGTYVESFEEENGIVNVKFANGKTASYDLVIGADGLGSRLRRMMIAKSPTSDSKDNLVELKERMGYFTIKKPIEDGEQYIGRGYLIPGRRFVLTRRHSPEEMQVYFGCNADETATESLRTMRRGDTKSEKAAFAETFRNCGWKTNELVTAMETGADDWYCQYTGFVTQQAWSLGHVTLVGDAAHGAPADGMGTSAALLGAYILAGEIERHHGRGDTDSQTGGDGVVAALEAYERKYQPYVRQIHKDLSAEPNVFDRIPWTPFTLQLFMYIAWFISFTRLDLIMARMMPIEGVKGWVLPEYAMVKS